MPSARAFQEGHNFEISILDAAIAGGNCYAVTNNLAERPGYLMEDSTRQRNGEVDCRARWEPGTRAQSQTPVRLVTGSPA